MRPGALVGVLMLLGATGAGAAETFVGKASAPPATAATPLTVTIREYTSDDRAFELAERLHKDGHPAVMAELAKGNAGTVKVGSGAAVRATMVRQEKTAAGRIVRIVTEKPLPATGNAPAPPDTVGYLELTLDASGKGTGRLLTAVRATFDAEGFVVPESLGETWAVTDVKPGS